ncbi:putative pseudouridine-5'-phosphatase, partial [Araneus ventricosus]
MPVVRFTITRQLMRLGRNEKICPDANHPCYTTADYPDYVISAERLVKHLYNNKIPLAIATSSKKKTYVLKTENHQELMSAFHHSVMSPDDTEVENGKPAPDVFLVCANRFEDKPSPEE